MRYRSDILALPASGHVGEATGSTSRRRDPVVLVVEDDAYLSQAIQPVCDFIGVQVEIVGPSDDVNSLIRDRRPISIITQLDTQTRDCCDVMQAAAAYDRSLPILIVAGGEDALLGVVDALEEMLALSQVSKVKVKPGCGDFADFLFKACRKHGHLGIVQI